MRQFRFSFLLKCFLTLALTASTIGVSAQKFTKNNLSPLKGQKEVNVVFDFSETLVYNRPAEIHIGINTEDLDDEDKEKWLNEWHNKMPEESYAQFIKLLNETIKQKGITAGDFPNAEYTFHVKIINIMPGKFNVLASNVSANISFVKTGQTTPLATVEYKRIWGKWSAYLPNHAYRIAKAFSYLGDKLGKDVSKNLK